MERSEFDLLFHWFVGLGIDDAMSDHSMFSKNQDLLLEREIAAKFMAALLTQPNVRQLLSMDHFSVGGTQVEAWAIMKSLRPKKVPGDNEPPTSGGRKEEVDFRSEKRSNQTHASSGDRSASSGQFGDEAPFS